MLTGFCGALFSGQLCASAILGEQVLFHFDLLWRKFQMDRKVNIRRAKEKGEGKAKGEFIPYYN